MIIGCALGPNFSFQQKEVKSAKIASKPFEGYLENGNLEEQPKPISIKKTVLLGEHALPK